MELQHKIKVIKVYTQLKKNLNINKRKDIPWYSKYRSCGMLGYKPAGLVASGTYGCNEGAVA